MICTAERVMTMTFQNAIEFSFEFEDQMLHNRDALQSDYLISKHLSIDTEQPPQKDTVHAPNSICRELDTVPSPKRSSSSLSVFYLRQLM